MVEWPSLPGSLCLALTLPGDSVDGHPATAGAAEGTVTKKAEAEDCGVAECRDQCGKVEQAESMP